MGNHLVYNGQYIHPTKGQIDRAEEFLMSPVFDPCFARVPLKRLQELRGMVERCANCNMSLCPEMMFVDRLLVTRQGITFPKGSTRETKQACIDFWTCLATIRVHMATDNYRIRSYATDFTGALTLDEQLPMPGARAVWSGWSQMPRCIGRLHFSHRNGVFV